MAYEKIIRPSTIQLRVPVSARSPQQQAVCDALVNGAGNVAVQAVAGSGKTETLSHVLHDYHKAKPEHSILVLAFQRDVKLALEQRIPESVADVKTAHGFCYGTASRGSKNPSARTTYGVVAHPKWANNRMGDLHIGGADEEHIIKFFKSKIGDDPKSIQDLAGLCKLLSLGKTTLTGLVPHYEGKKLVNVTRESKGLKDLIARFGIEFSEKLTNDEAAEFVIQAMEWTKEGPGLSNQRKAGRYKGAAPTAEKKSITFDDQIWLPLINGWKLPSYDLILVDECQDLSPARLLAVQLALNEKGRALVVGDVFQAIFGFAGAEVNAMPTLIEKLDAKILPLSVTYRCARSIVAEARRVDSRIEIEARAEAPEGIVEQIDAKQLAEMAKPSDVIISRTNAPLVKIFFQFAKTGKQVVMLGRDYGAMLAYRIKSWQRHAGDSFTGRDLLDYNQAWLTDRLSRLGDGNAAAKERAHDEADTVAALCEDLPGGLDNTGAPALIISRIYKAFSHDKAGSENVVTLASTHKFKGDERNRVFLLVETYKPGEDQEETNLLYVGITRAKERLTYVTGIKGGTGGGQDGVNHRSSMDQGD